MKPLNNSYNINQGMCPYYFNYGIQPFISEYGYPFKPTYANNCWRSMPLSTEQNNRAKEIGIEFTDVNQTLIVNKLKSVKDSQQAIVVTNENYEQTHTNILFKLDE